jgi:hypothetical protein
MHLITGASVIRLPDTRSLLKLGYAIQCNTHKISQVKSVVVPLRPLVIVSNIKKLKFL